MPFVWLGSVNACMIAGSDSPMVPVLSRACDPSINRQRPSQTVRARDKTKNNACHHVASIFGRMRHDGMASTFLPVWRYCRRNRCFFHLAGRRTGDGGPLPCVGMRGSCGKDDRSPKNQRPPVAWLCGLCLPQRIATLCCVSEKRRFAGASPALWPRASAERGSIIAY